MQHVFFFVLCFGDHPDLHVPTHSFPTRRSSDLKRFALLQLAPLSASGHRQFLEMLMGGSKLGDDLVQKFYDATEGNPYFTSELVRSDRKSTRLNSRH